MRILNYAVYTWSKYLRILNYALYTRVTENVILLSRAWRRGTAVSGLPANQTCMCVVYVSFACAARCIIGGNGLEGHTSSAPQNTILRSSHSYTDFVAWFARIVTGKHLCTVIWDAHFKLRFATWFGIHTVFFCVFWILIQNAFLHLELKFKIRTLPSCENSLCDWASGSRIIQLLSWTSDRIIHVEPWHFENGILQCIKQFCNECKTSIMWTL